ncbi:glycosyltransferase family 2 protein [Flavobacterium ginsenosidimutans]|uniref:Glycosyltransferase family 2 protein n=1 Tax=Flavobacterium ginsenosidimutans TaxID=687844 RepID=A0ABZ2Q898_9FLAO|nr:glycosyltransferase family 2 protein [Flavobacterium ginsenosidimutans]KAF2334176.1 glycosyltransferase family 2 protein [Flavobacterium ginsenosidimutans]
MIGLIYLVLFVNNPLVSIIIPTYNRAHLIEETLDSILIQTYQNWECIIVDDGSTDNTVEVINKFIKKDSRFQLHHRPLDRKPGGNASRNYGFELSKGEFINWFDDDDVMMDAFLSEKLELFSEEIDLVICSGTYTDQNLTALKNIDLEIKSYLFKDYVLWKLQILTPSILFRKSFLKNKELFNVNIARGQEAELFSRLFYNLSPNKYIILNKSLFLYRQHEKTKTFTNFKYIKLFEESKTIIAIENLKKSIQLNDLELVGQYYFNIVNSFYRGLEQKHFKNCFFITRKASSQFYLINKKIGIEFFLSACFFMLINRGSYKAEKYFKKFYS